MLETEPTYVEVDGEQKGINPPPYMCIGNNRQDIYYQNGKFYTGKGEPEINWKEVPKWFWAIVRKSYPPETIAKWNLIFPEDRAKMKEDKIEKVIVKKRGRPVVKKNSAEVVMTPTVLTQE